VIVVDTSVWIDHLNGTSTNQVTTLRALIGRVPLLVGDLILCEVLQGLASDKEARLVENALRRFELVSMVTPDLAVRSASNYRLLRGKGITVRKTIDLLIGAFCIAHGHSLLHSDRDFDPMQKHLGLRVVSA
jgi:predicted nucleic acid-binding protein